MVLFSSLRLYLWETQFITQWFIQTPDVLLASGNIHDVPESMKQNPTVTAGSFWGTHGQETPNSWQP